MSTYYFDFSILMGCVITELSNNYSDQHEYTSFNNLLSVEKSYKRISIPYYLNVNQCLRSELFWCSSYYLNQQTFDLNLVLFLYRGFLEQKLQKVELLKVDRHGCVNRKQKFFSLHFLHYLFAFIFRQNLCEDALLVAILMRITDSTLSRGKQIFGKNRSNYMELLT